MPKFINGISHGEQKQIPPINKSSQQQQQRKIPPKPPQRRYPAPSQVRHEPEGMQQQPVFTAKFHEKKTFQLAIVQQTHKLAREPLKPPPQIFTTAHFTQQNQHLLTHLPNQMQSLSHFSQNNFLPHNRHNNNVMFGAHHHHNNNNHHSFNNFQQQRQHLQHQQQQMIFHSQLRQQQLVIAGMQMRMSAMRNRRYLPTRYGSGSSGSDPENHIYEIIDEEEAQIQSQKLLPNKPQVPYKIESIKEADESGELFQTLLNAEMTNQIEICNKDNGYLSHLTHAKRMDIIQETAISIATAAYVEK